MRQLLQELLKADCDVIVRPHPQHVRHKGEWLRSLADAYKGSKIQFQLDFSSHDSVLNADVMITDWSGIAFEYSFIWFVNSSLKP